jgi:hypothetical protein
VAISGVGSAGNPSSIKTPSTALVSGAHPVEVRAVALAKVMAARALKSLVPGLQEGF